MAVSDRYNYVRHFETHDICPLHTWPVVRVDGKNFHRFSKIHCFEKPNDERALRLMNETAVEVMTEITEINMAYGQSDEYSFVYARDTSLYGRRKDKLTSAVVSLFTARYCVNWARIFLADDELEKKKTPEKIETSLSNDALPIKASKPGNDTPADNNEKTPDKDKPKMIEIPLIYPATFDGRLISYPTTKVLLDYLCWRQIDCHINNLYNTTFWKLVSRGLSERDAEKRLRATFSGNKHDILWDECENFNYSKEPELFKKGCFLYRKKRKRREREKKAKCGEKEEQLICRFEGDLIGGGQYGNKFWVENQHLVEPKDGDIHQRHTKMYALQQQQCKVNADKSRTRSPSTGSEMSSDEEIPPQRRRMLIDKSYVFALLTALAAFFIFRVV